jgi:aryl-alcohol dehydrogenase-like predicted oxidoreductase
MWAGGAVSDNDFRYRTLPVVGKRVLRLGLASSFGIDTSGVECALSELDMNYVFWTPRMSQATPALKNALRRDRERYVVATGPTTAWWGGNLRRFVDRALSILDTDYLDVLQMHWLGVTSAWTGSTVDVMSRLREEGRVRALGVSIHNRRRAGALAAESPLDLLMIRYNAAHPGAEEDIFPHLATGRRAVVAYTATAWRRLLKPRRGWTGAIPTAGHCYRFCLSNPNVDVVLTGPKTPAQLRENLTALEEGPLDEEEMGWMREFGRVVHG